MSHPQETDQVGMPFSVTPQTGKKYTACKREKTQKTTLAGYPCLIPLHIIMV